MKKIYISPACTAYEFYQEGLLAVSGIGVVEEEVDAGVAGTNKKKTDIWGNEPKTSIWE
ncbi:MAG: hypothetical protein MR881_04115 [Bacteroidales bacterium]|nr:hypothetical protein [Bacteroidales bacterium]MDY4662922.1 hypothetical protein [Alloprevotella sp.]